jgi:hypothetical protein
MTSKLIITLLLNDYEFTNKREDFITYIELQNWYIETKQLPQIHGNKTISTNNMINKINRAIRAHATSKLFEEIMPIAEKIDDKYVKVWTGIKKKSQHLI